MFKWEAHPDVHLLLWHSMAEQTQALARLSFFLEDAELHGQVIKQFPVGRRGGVLAYSGHNMRTSDIVEFLDAAAAEGVELWPQEDAVIKMLVDAGLIKWQGGAYIGTKASIISTCTQHDLKEAKETLLHEAM